MATSTTRQVNIRLATRLIRAVRQVAKQRGFRYPGQFVRALLEAAVAATEETILLPTPTEKETRS